MRTKKLAIISIAIAFAIVVICSVITTFTVRHVDAVFSVSEKNAEKMDAINDILNGYVGKNLLFCDIGNLEKEIEKDPYVEVTSIVKKFPDVIELQIRDRKEIYVLQYENKYYVLSEEGVVLKQSDTFIGGREYIQFNLDGLEILSLNVGDYIHTDDDLMLAVAFDIAEVARYTDCVKELTLKKGVDVQDVIFSTYTAVEIEVRNILDEGKKKAEKAFTAYDNETRDYIKSNNKIIVTKEDDGDIVAVWSYHGN